MAYKTPFQSRSVNAAWSFKNDHHFAEHLAMATHVWTAHPSPHWVLSDADVEGPTALSDDSASVLKGIGPI